MDNPIKWLIVIAILVLIAVVAYRMRHALQYFVKTASRRMDDLNAEYKVKLERLRLESVSEHATSDAASGKTYIDAQCKQVD